MGRSRAVNHSAEEDSSQSRSKRKRTASNLENLEAATSGQGMSEGKKALYHCNYCNKDIFGKIRIKCACCSDFDLCVECFSVGAEVYPHKSNHPYRVMDNLSFPLFCSDWNADEEILLLEGIEMYRLANWNEVAEHVGTKSKSHCIEHYNTIYMKPCFPLPGMSHVMGKNREELLAMATKDYWWPNLKREVAKYVEECLTCRKVKAEHERPHVKLQSLDIPEWKWEHITMDLITKLLRTPRDFDTIWVIVDRLTKSSHFHPIQESSSSENLADIYLREIVVQHGVRISIVSDRDVRCSSKF